MDTNTLARPHTPARTGRLAWIVAWAALVLGALHALARFRTASGQGDLEYPLVALWAEPMGRLLLPLLDWADPEIVYVTYGKIWAPAFAAMALVVIQAYRARAPRGFERWAWWTEIAGWVSIAVGAFVTYWTQRTGAHAIAGTAEDALMNVGMLIVMPGLLLVLLGSTALGISLLALRFRPRLPALLLAAAIPLAFAVLQVTSLGNAVLPVMFAFGLLGRGLASPGPAESGNPTVSARPGRTAGSPSTP